MNRAFVKIVTSVVSVSETNQKVVWLNLNLLEMCWFDGIRPT